MTSPRYTAPKATHSRVINHLYISKKPYVDPNTADAEAQDRIPRGTMSKFLVRTNAADGKRRQNPS